MTADLTHDASGPGAVTYGLECAEHPDARRRGLTQAHATNAVAKHNRDHHEEGPTADLVNVSAACQAAVDCLWTGAMVDDSSPLEQAQALAVHHAALLFLETLTGLKGDAAAYQAQEWANARPAISAHVAPF